MDEPEVSYGESLPERGGLPEPLLQGTFAIYETPDGGMVLTYYTETTGEGQQIIPPFLVKQGKKMMANGGMPMRMRGRKAVKG